MTPEHDLLIVGGGINGTAIARDAAKRGLSVLLCEQGDIAGATSSASSKMIHGGLRYLEHYEFRLVAEALAEREVMLRIAPHLARPLTIVMPHVATQRPAWLIRLGLLLYDTLGRWQHPTHRPLLPTSSALDLRQSPYAEVLQTGYPKGFAYADVLDDDARLTLATARAAAMHGATIQPRTRLLAAQRQDQGHGWLVRLEHHGQPRDITARALINAAGPWVAAVRDTCLPRQDKNGSPPPPRATVRLIKGSHIVVPRLYPGNHGWLLQNTDHRVLFVLPFEEHHTLIGTTEIPHPHLDTPPRASAAEIDYLCQAVARFFRHPPRPEDVVWHYAGVRPLHEDGHHNAGDVTRDYVFELDGRPDEAPLLSIFGGKLTTHRRLAEAALDRLKPWFPQLPASTTAHHPLPGGDFTDFPQLLETLQQRYPQLPSTLLASLARRHGSNTPAVLMDARTPADLGQHFGGNLYAREVTYFITHEWAHTADDILWRRSKAGLHLSAAQHQVLGDWLATHHPELSVSTESTEPGGVPR